MHFWRTSNSHLEALLELIPLEPHRQFIRGGKRSTAQCKEESMLYVKVSGNGDGAVCVSAGGGIGRCLYTSSLSCLSRDPFAKWLFVLIRDEAIRVLQSWPRTLESRKMELADLAGGTTATTWRLDDPHI